MLSEDGLIANHTLTVRDGEDRFRTLASPPWPLFQQHKFDFDVQVELNEIFILQVAGPRSLEILEKVLGKDIRDLGFLDFVPTSIPGVDAPVELELSRIGMAGTLAYEIRGPLEAGPAVYDAVYQAGKPLGIKRLGWRTYAVNHTEGGFPQLGVTWLASMILDPAVQHSPLGPLLEAPLTGSVDPSDVRARMRTPQEVNWAWMGKFDHDFVGREAMEAEAADPKRKTVILRWNPEDLVDVFASQFEQGEPYKFIEFPVAPQQPAGGHADLVTKDGKPVGISSAAVYSFYYREMISQTTIDLDQAEIGNEVVVHWGDFGKRIKEVRAVVERFPYLDLPSNRDYDLHRFLRESDDKGEGPVAASATGPCTCIGSATLLTTVREFASSASSLEFPSWGAREFGDLGVLSRRTIHASWARERTTNNRAAPMAQLSRLSATFGELRARRRSRCGNASRLPRGSPPFRTRAPRRSRWV